MRDALMRAVNPQNGSRPIWKRSGFSVATVLLTFKEVAPADTSALIYLTLAVVLVLAHHIWAPTVPLHYHEECLKDLDTHGD